jgi:hypothetical protein
MDMDGGSVTRPPLLDGTNYDYWNSRMVAFLKSMDSQTWKAIIKGWEHPVMRGDKCQKKLKYLLNYGTY